MGGLVWGQCVRNAVTYGRTPHGRYGLKFAQMRLQRTVQYAGYTSGILGQTPYLSVRPEDKRREQAAISSAPPVTWAHR